MTTTRIIGRTGLGLGSILVLLCLSACGGGSTSDGSVTPTGVQVTADMSITWNSPNTTVNHDCLQNLSSYRIYIGLAPGVYSVNIPVAVGDASCSSDGQQQNSCGAIETCTYTVENLIGWTGRSWHFAVTAIDDEGNESAYSSEVSHAINN